MAFGPMSAAAVKDRHDFTARQPSSRGILLMATAQLLAWRRARSPVHNTFPRDDVIDSTYVLVQVVVNQGQAALLVVVRHGIPSSGRLMPPQNWRIQYQLHHLILHIDQEMVRVIAIIISFANLVHASHHG